MRPILSLLLLPALAVGTLALLPACQTAATFPAPTAQWQTFTGQMHYAGKRSVVGEVVVRESGPNFQLAFASGPGFPLMRLWSNGSVVRTEGVLAHGSWQVAMNHVPAPLRGWAALPTAFASISPAHPKFSGNGTTAEASFAGNRLLHLVVTSGASGERFTFHFSN